MDRVAPESRDESYQGVTFRGRSQRGDAGLASSGPNCQLIARAAPSSGLAEQALASLFWWCYVRTGKFLDSRGIGDLRDQRQIIVSHDGGTRYSLLLLSPNVHGPFGSLVAPIEFGFPPQSPGLRDIALAGGDRLHAMLVHAGIQVDQRSAVLAVSELATRDYFSLVVAPPPGETLTAAPPAPGAMRFVAPAPALPVTISSSPRVVATAGVVGADATGRVLAVTARHAVIKAVANGSEIRVGGAVAGTVTCHEVTDSCVLSVSCDALTGIGRSGLLGFPPGEHRVAAFNGAASGRKETRIRGYDLSVLDPSPYLGSKVYTDPDTIPGDSGSALIDGDDHVAGFAVSRTALGAPLEFSTWSWAQQVLAAHGLAWPQD
jgi:hypothetical protein